VTLVVYLPLRCALALALAAGAPAVSRRIPPRLGAVTFVAVALGTALAADTATRHVDRRTRWRTWAAG
jgi:hypothetical protein